MFTGLIEEIGVISTLTPHDPSTAGGSGTSLTIASCPLILSDAKLGDSISVNGTCLTITELSPSPSSSLPTSSKPPSNPSPPPRSEGTPLPPRSDSATETATLTSLTAAISPLEGSSPSTSAEHNGHPKHEYKSFKLSLSPETLVRTNLGALSQGSRVNLERAVKGEVRMGGHFVQGHVDAVARITGVREEGNMVVYRFAPVERDGGEKEGEGGDVLRYIVEKGYVALDGASLTVTGVGGEEEGGGRGKGKGWWEVMLIPYTRTRVVMGGKGVGDSVNVEVDMVGKYVERSVRGFLEGGVEELPGLEAMVRRIVREEVESMGLGGRGRGLVEG